MSDGTSFVIQVGMLADLVVSNDPSHSGNVVLRWLDGTDKNQQWTMEPAPNGYYLRNAATGTYLTATGQNAPVILGPHGDVWQKTGPDNQLSAIRLTLNTSQNLNALGASPYVGTTVGTWSWGGGKGNETWLITSVSAVWPRPTRIFSYISGMATYLQLSIDPANPAGALVVDDNYASPSPANFIFTATQWFSGFSIVNKQSGLLAYVGGNGNGAQLLQRASGQMNTDALWTYGGSGTFQAIRPWINSGQNWNVFGNPHPIPKGPLPMGTWKWGGGQPNEVWQTTAPSLHVQATSELLSTGAAGAEQRIAEEEAPAASVAEIWERATSTAGDANRPNGHH
ncbi:hypothetical protein GCM10011611_01880 [Aliidongia dinghuensis]|uniref:Ricin B lectin domain-containing protein n=1 Tax=Aliidongia dinghuensis TaxID=1867774 RepID=A0A8J2YNM6_9PROT|nr:RICIN domain-containing protein [Aliidongia dinghuensis]GGE99907.1 hypothetical protein GCM10011611_01880 [Aliidongia dinghuensis]